MRKGWHPAARKSGAGVPPRRPTVVREHEEPEAVEAMRQMSTEDLIALVQQRRHLRSLESRPQEQ
jgi:hypothetical protein